MSGLYLYDTVTELSLPTALINVNPFNNIIYSEVIRFIDLCFYFSSWINFI